MKDIVLHNPHPMTLANKIVYSTQSTPISQIQEHAILNVDQRNFSLPYIDAISYRIKKLNSYCLEATENCC